MLESHVYRGFWWLPGKDDQKLAGDLTLDRGKAELSVLGSFGHEVLSESGGERVLAPIPRDVDRILGHTAKGKAVTLETCTVGDAQINIPGIATTTYRPAATLLGAWFTEGEEVTFDEISMTTSDLIALDFGYGYRSVRHDGRRRGDGAGDSARLRYSLRAA